MKTYALAQVGKPHDYGFATFDDARMYCTERVARTLMQGPNSPRFKGILSGAGPIMREIHLNEGFLTSPDFEPIWKTRSYEKTPSGQANPITIKK